MATRLQQLRRFRNRIHIKTVEDLEYASYTHGVANAMLNLLDEFRLVVKPWFEARAVAETPALVDALVPTPTTSFAPEADYDAAPDWLDEPF